MDEVSEKRNNDILSSDSADLHIIINPIVYAVPTQMGY